MCKALPDHHATGYAAFFPARIFAHRARCAAAIRFLPAGDIVRLGFGARPFAFAHRAFCARLIRLRTEADTPRFGLVELRPPPNLPSTERAASTCRSSFTKFVLTAFNFDTKPASPARFAMSPPRQGIVIDRRWGMGRNAELRKCRWRR